MKNEWKSEEVHTIVERQMRVCAHVHMLVCVDKRKNNKGQEAAEL